MGKQVARVCTILARGGSKGLPGKNVTPLLGKPLIAHSIAQAAAAGLFDAVVVSSDSQKILDVAREWGAPHVVERPVHMATDTASKLPAIQHAVLAVEAKMGVTFDTIVDIDVTSPLRTADDIRGAVNLLEDRGVANVITGAPARRNPYFNLVEQEVNGRVRLSKPTTPRIERRQDCPTCFDMNAAVYVWRREPFMSHADVFYADTLLYEMPEDRSHDIDSKLDFEFVEFLLHRQEAR